MHCDDAARALYMSETGETLPDLEVHLSACDECRLLAEDVAGMNQAFASARAEWAPSPAFRVDLPLAPWRRLAIAASLLVIPLAGWAASTLWSPRTNFDVASLLEPRAAAEQTDRELLGTLFLGEAQE